MRVLEHQPQVQGSYGLRLVARSSRAVWSTIRTSIHAITSFVAANEQRERALSLEERLQQTGRIRYR
jgi:hypothetical protein